MFAKSVSLWYDKNMDMLEKNQIHTVTIDGYTSEALGVCHLNGRAIFVPRALPGERWEIRIVKVSPSVIYARGETLLTVSPSRAESDCPYYGRCGGCDTRHMHYEEELRFKLDRVNSALTRIGKQATLAEDILGSEETARYRNKGIFTIAKENGKAVFGFYRERSHALIAMSDCLIQKTLCIRVASAVTDFMNENLIQAYDEKSGRGLVRHVFCRESLHREDAVACIVAAGGFGSLTENLVAFLRARCPELTGIVLNVNKSSSNTVLSGTFYTLWGRDYIRDTLCGLSFSIAPQAFFQINPPQAEKLYQKALDYAQLGPHSLALDLYCGAGTISLCLARQADHVIGAEIVPKAIENAKANAAQNGVANVEFICADAGKAAEELATRGLRPDVIVVDPPRKGMDDTAITAIVRMRPERVVYVSCNPATLARDILRFQPLGYSLRHATAVDMFPKTCHTECVALLVRDKF